VLYFQRCRTPGSPVFLPPWRIVCLLPADYTHFYLSLKEQIIVRQQIGNPGQYDRDTNSICLNYLMISIT
jgi:hypothetical protein